MAIHSTKLAFVALWLLAAYPAAWGQAPTPLLVQSEDQLIAVLKSDAPLKDKVDACRQLAVIGTKEAVAPLVALLSDEQLSHSARYGLETLRDPSVNPALREALGALQGRPLIGVIGTLGVRRDPRAVRPLTRFLEDANPEVVQAAARALGSIGNPAATKTLLNALDKAAPESQLAFYEGLFRGAERLARRRSADALAVYDRLRQAQAPHQVRAGALRGAILVRGVEGLPLLKESLHSQDFVLVDAAIRAALEMPGSEVTAALVAELPQLPADHQLQVISVLGKRADAAALPGLFAAAKSGAMAIRLAALRALPEIGTAATVPVLVELLHDTDRQIAQVAQEDLAATRGPEAEAAVLALLKSSQVDDQLAGLDLVARRRMVNQVPALVELAAKGEPQVRPAAVRKLGEIGAPSAFEALLGLLRATTASTELQALEGALIQLAPQAKLNLGADPSQFLADLKPAQARVFLALLAVTGGENALKSVRNAAHLPDSQVRAAAIRALTSWKTPEAAEALLDLAQTADDPTDRLLCLRSYLGWAANTDLPAKQRLGICQTAAPLVQQAEQKKLLLSALGNLVLPESMNLIAPYLEDPVAKEEAAAAVVAVADKLLQGQNGGQIASRLIAPLQKAAQATSNPSLAQRASALLKKVRD